MTAILVATIGTRDLMFQISSGLWYGVGNFSERVQVIDDLGLDKEITHRDLTKYLGDRADQYLDRIKPAIMGKLLTEKAPEIEHLYLIDTDQLSTIKERNKDTIYSCQILAAWGADIQDRSQWQSRILACLNILTGQSFESLHQASLFANVHDRIRRSIEV